LLHYSDHQRGMPRLRLYTIYKRSVYQPAIFKSRAILGMVPAGGSSMGIELHGVHHDAPYDPGISVWRVQISTRVDLGQRCLSTARYARHGLHRAGHAFRSGRLLGTDDRRVHYRAGTAYRSATGARAARWTD